MDTPHGYVAGMKKVYRNTENDEEVRIQVTRKDIYAKL